LYKILVCDPISSKAIDLLRAHGFHIDFVKSPPPNVLSNIISEYDVIIVRSATKVTEQVIENAKKLKIIARAGAGLDNIAVEYALQREIKVINAPEALTIAVAEHTFALMLMLLRKEYEACKSLKDKKLWLKKQFLGEELYGKTLGIIGLGAIGGEVAKRALAFGMDVMGYRRTNLIKTAQRLGIRPAKNLSELLSSSDIITLHVPLTKETYHMIGWREISLMKKGVYIINTSRGAVIDGRSLLHALNVGHVAGAALDVFEHEPPKESWEWKLILHPRVIATPHIGSMTREAQEKAGLIVARKIISEFG